jgi:type IV pilus assembly protein PilA
MEDTLRQENRESRDRGFTLIELLVVVVIIGVLVAIAIPLYMNYRKGALNKSAQSDIRTAISAVEQYYTENSNTYPASVETSAPGASISLSSTGGTATSVTVSPGNNLRYRNNTTSYVICAVNTDGNVIFRYDSSVGGSVQKATGAFAGSLAACAP